MPVSLMAFSNAAQQKGYLRLGDGDNVRVKSKGFLGLKAAFSNAAKNKAVKQEFVAAIRQRYGDDFANQTATKIGVNKGGALSNRTAQKILQKAEQAPRKFLEQNGMNLPAECEVTAQGDLISVELKFGSQMAKASLDSALKAETAKVELAKHHGLDKYSDKVTEQFAKELPRISFLFNDGERDLKTQRGEKNLAKNLQMFCDYCEKLGVDSFAFSKVLTQEIFFTSERDKIAALTDMGIGVATNGQPRSRPDLGLSISVYSTSNGFSVEYRDAAELNYLECGERRFMFDDLPASSAMGAIKQELTLHFAKQDLKGDLPPFDVVVHPRFELSFQLSKDVVSS